MWGGVLGGKMTVIYMEVNDEIENLTYKMGVFMYAVGCPFFIIPGLLQSFYQYYILNMGEESFITIFPAS